MPTRATTSKAPASLLEFEEGLAAQQYAQQQAALDAEGAFGQQYALQVERGLAAGQAAYLNAMATWEAMSSIFSAPSPPKAAGSASAPESVVRWGKTSAESLEGGRGNDTLRASAGNDSLSGADGNDSLEGEVGDDSLSGDGGADSLSGGAGSDTVLGGLGNDSVDGNNSDDRLDGGAGRDTLLGGDGHDELLGQAGADRLDGGRQDDRLDGGAGNDTLLGGDGIGADWLSGGAGNDELAGGAGNDTLVGGAGSDLLFGGAGSDVFRFDGPREALPGGLRPETIGDFEAGFDRIDLSGIDARPGEAGDQAFVLLATRPAAAAPGSLWIEAAGADSWVMGDANGDGVADLAVLVVGTMNLHAADFVL